MTHDMILATQATQAAASLNSIFVKNTKSERGILYNDSLLNIDWKLNKEEFILSEKDQNNPIFSKAEYFIFEDD